MTKNEVLKEYLYCIEEYKNLLDKIYKVRNYSSEEECMKVVYKINDRLRAINDSYLRKKQWDEEYFALDDHFTAFFNDEKHLIKSSNQKIDYLTEKFGRKGF